MHFMERSEFGQNLTKAFEVWKEGRATKADVESLGEAINFAMANGIDLVLKVPKSVLDKTADTRPILRQDAIFFSTGTDGDLLVFDIPSEINKYSIGSRALELKAIANYRDFGPCVLLKSRSVGTFGSFLPGEVASIEPK
jgi:hypothetical protein